MMKKVLSILLLALLTITAANAQRWMLQRYRLYIGLTNINYFGDIGGASTESSFLGLADLDFSYSKPAIYLGALYKYQENIDFKLNLYYGSIFGMDDNSLNQARQLKFSTTIFEPSLQVNYIFFMQKRHGGSGRIFSRRGMLNSFEKFEAAIFGGVGAAIFNPSAEFIDGRPITSRNGGVEFSSGASATMVVPLGLSLNYIVNNSWELGLEVGGRLSLSDYIDGFSSQYSSSNDVYYFSTLSMIYRIKSDRRGRPILFRKY